MEPEREVEKSCPDGFWDCNSVSLGSVVEPSVIWKLTSVIYQQRTQLQRAQQLAVSSQYCVESQGREVLHRRL